MKKIVIFSKSYCPYCAMAQKLLQKKGLEFTLKEVDEHQEEFNKLKIENSHSTVPMIFIDDIFIGGFDSLSALEKSGSL